MSALFGAIAAGLCVGVAYYVYKKGAASKNDECASMTKKVIDGTLPFNDIVSWFKSLSLDKNKDIPFICLADKFPKVVNDKFNLDIEGMQSTTDTPSDGNKKVRLVLGVFDEEKGKVSNIILLEAGQLDERTLQVLGDESLVVLS